MTWKTAIYYMENWGILHGKLGDMTWKTGGYDVENWGILHGKLGDMTWKMTYAIHVDISTWIGLSNYIQFSTCNTRVISTCITREIHKFCLLGYCN